MLRGAAVSKTSRSASKLWGALRLVPLRPAHNRAPCPTRLIVPIHAMRRRNRLALSGLKRENNEAFYRVNQTSNAPPSISSNVRCSMFVFELKKGRAGCPPAIPGQSLPIRFPKGGSPTCIHFPSGASLPIFLKSKSRLAFQNLEHHVSGLIGMRLRPGISSGYHAVGFRNQFVQV